MIYRDFQGLKLSGLGFGAMRLPVLADGSVNEHLTTEMVRYAMEHGVNYFDTAYPYHGGMSEVVLGRALSAYPRESYYLATKYPGHQLSDSYDPAAVFEEQLKKCGVEYFDFYLMHNVYENSIRTYTDPRWGIVDYFVEQKRLGRIRHLGFSCHGGLDILREFLDRYGDVMEFCQIQLNWLDWKLQAGMLSSGRRLFNRASSASDSFARRPPRTGSMTHTGMPRSVSSSYLVLPSWSFQSSQFSWIWQNSITSP